MYVGVDLMKSKKANQNRVNLSLRTRVAILLPVLLGFLAQWLMNKRELTWGLVLWALAIVIFFFIARPLIKQVDNKKLLVESGRSIPLKVELAFFVLVLVIGVFFRLYMLNSIPPGLNHDAAWNGLYAITITQGIPYAPYVNAAWGRETMFHYIIAFYQLLIGPEKLAINLAAVTVGIATLIAFYFLIRRLFNPSTAIISALLLSISGWHVTLSKVGWRVILVPFFTCLILYFLVKAMQERRTRDFVLAGVSLGLGLDTYDAARIFPFIVAGYLIYEGVRKPSFLRTYSKQLTVFALAAIIAFSPLGWYTLNHWQEFTGRSRHLWIGTQIEEKGSIEPILMNFKNAVLLFNFRGNGNDFFIEEPLLDSPLSVFFVFGLVIAVARWRKPPYFMLLLALVLTLLIGIISTPNGNRNFGAIVSVLAFAGLFVTETWTWFCNSFPTYRRAITGCLVAVLLLTSYLSYQTYLGPDRREQLGFYPEGTRAGLYMKGIASEYDIHAVAGNWPRDALTYLSYQGTGDPFKWVYTYSFNASEILQNASELLSRSISNAKRGTAFIIEAVPENQPAFEALAQRFASGRTDKIYYGEKLVANVLLVPQGNESQQTKGELTSDSEKPKDV